METESAGRARTRGRHEEKGMAGGTCELHLGASKLQLPFFFFLFFFSFFGGMILCFHSVLVHSDPQYLSERIGEL